MNITIKIVILNSTSLTCQLKYNENEQVLSMLHSPVQFVG